MELLENLFETGKYDASQLAQSLRSIQNLFQTSAEKRSTLINQLYEMAARRTPPFEHKEWNMIRFRIYTLIAILDPQTRRAPLVSVRTSSGLIFYVVTLLLSPEDVVQQFMECSEVLIDIAFQSRAEDFHIRTAVSYATQFPVLIADSSPVDVYRPLFLAAFQRIPNQSAVVFNDAATQWLRELIWTLCKRTSTCPPEVIDCIPLFFRMGKTCSCPVLGAWFSIWYQASRKRMIPKDHVQAVLGLLKANAKLQINDLPRLFPWNLAIDFYCDIEGLEACSWAMRLVLQTLRLPTMGADMIGRVTDEKCLNAFITRLVKQFEGQM
jgi:hypothetical protein